jgi:hypothetical protein
LLAPDFERSWVRGDTRMWSATPPRKRLAIALNFLATGATYTTLADQWGVGRSSVAGIVHPVIDAIAALSPEWIKFPSSEAEILHAVSLWRQARTNRFYAYMPMCVGVVDGCAIPMLGPGGGQRPQALQL